jgi:membrane protease YdiL (CAAX protease family)
MPNPYFNLPMKSVRIHYRLLIFLTISLAIACVTSPWMALGADWFAAEWPNLLSERVPFEKIFNRAFMIAGIILFLAYRHFLLPSELLNRLLIPGFRIGLRNFIAGFGLALISLVLLAAVMVASEVFTPYFRLAFAKALSRCASALAASVFIGFLEEVFFRGMLFLGLLQHRHPLRAYVLANVFYASIHFVKPGDDYFLDRLDLLAGFRHLLTTFEPFLELNSLIPGIIGLFLIGMVLSYALQRTGNLYLAIGLHAGWIFSLRTFRVFGNFTREELGWAFGSTDPKIVSGVVTWIGILLVGVAVSRLTRRVSLPSSAEIPPATA